MVKPVTLYQTAETENQEMDNFGNNQRVTEPIRESLVLFIFKITSILIITNLVYMGLNFFLLRAFFLNHELPFNIHDNTAYILTLLHFATTAFQVWGISTVVFRWVGNSYHIKQKHLVQREGIMNCTEKIYDLDIVRSISIQQSWLGKIFRYGTVNVEISASGGYTDQATLSGVSDPRQYEKMLRRHF